MMIDWCRENAPNNPHCGESPGRRQHKNLAGDTVVIRSSLGGPAWSSVHRDEPSDVRGAVSHIDDQQ